MVGLGSLGADSSVRPTDSRQSSGGSLLAVELGVSAKIFGQRSYSLSTETL